ncbi:hemicentin-2-like isoform X2 [Halichondria panicea]|uniref:hemicentin-2-like isoform X2 n=1 Tax=Halichondria panicea TaxID=6063 RepID=UPI00312B7A54
MPTFLKINLSNPVAIATVPTLSLTLGSQTLFHALITFVSGSPHPTMEQITWTVNGAPSTVTGHVFQLPLNINWDHAGLYVCSVTTAQGAATAEFTVTVNVQPQVTLSPATVPPVEKGGSFTLTCADREGTPPPTFEWSRDNQVISGDGSRVLVTASVEDVSSTLTIMSVELGDAGSYSCTGANGAGASTRRTDVIVLYAPILTPISTRTIWVVGQTLLLEASLVGAVPRTIDSVAWTKDGANSRGTPSSEGSKYTLTVPGLTLGDEGMYELTLTNEIGAGIPLSFSITVNLPPVYVSITNYPVMNSLVAIDTIGDTTETALTCRTNSTICCTGQDNPNSANGLGDWLFPNGTVVTRNQDITDSDTDLLYSVGDTGALRLHRRGSVSGLTGSYCCVIPDNTGVDVTFCVQLVTGVITISPPTTTSTDESCFCQCPQSDNTGAVVGGVVALVAVIAVTVVMVTYLVLRYKRGGKMTVPRDISLTDQGQSAAATYETVLATYEEIPASREVKGDYSYTQNNAYSTVSGREAPAAGGIQ